MWVRMRGPGAEHKLSLARRAFVRRRPPPPPLLLAPTKVQPPGDRFRPCEHELKHGHRVAIRTCEQ